MPIVTSRPTIVTGAASRNTAAAASGSAQMFELGRCGDVPHAGRPTHDRQSGGVGHEVRIALERKGDVGERPTAYELEAVDRSGCVADEPDRVVRLGGDLELRELHRAHSGLAVNPGGIEHRLDQRPLGPPVHPDVQPRDLTVTSALWVV